MAKAHITTGGGTKVTIEGTPEEVAALIKTFESGVATRAGRADKARSRKAGVKTGPVSLIAELIDGGFFKKPKELSAIKLALAEQGHHYPVTTLSPLLLRLVRKRELRRIKDEKRWLYVG